MKVLQINAVNLIRSTGRICIDISDYLNKNGYEGYIAYSVGIKYEKGYKIGNTFDVKIHGFFSRLFGLQAYFSRLETRKLLNYISELKPDIVHLHNLHGNYINLKMLLNYLAKSGMPTVLTLHDCWYFTGKCTHYTVDGCYKWKSGCGNCPRLKKDNKSWFLDRTKKMYKDKKEWFEKIPSLAIVGVSEWITYEARSSLLSTANIITRIYNWIDVEIFKAVSTETLRQKLKIQGKFIILGVASGWSSAKGLNEFLKLSELISEDMVIILVGNMNKNVTIRKNVINIKETHNASELVEYYSMADVFINLSMEESFGKVTAEALACGTPVITINSTANPELIGECCGYVVENNNVEDVFKHICCVQKKGKIYYSKYCIAQAKKSFRKNDRIEDYVSLYKKLHLNRRF